MNGEPKVQINEVWGVVFRDGSYILQKRGQDFRSYKDIKAMAGETHRLLGGGFKYDDYLAITNLKPRNFPDETSNQEPIGVSHWLEVPKVGREA